MINKRKPGQPYAGTFNIHFSHRGINYKAHTDTNTNTKSYRYQFVIGDKNAKTIGIYLIDSGFLETAEIAHDLFIAVYFIRDYLVLRLAAVDTLYDILALDFIDPHSQIVLVCTLLFIRAHLASVNKKSKVNRKRADLYALVVISFLVTYRRSQYNNQE